MRPGIATFVVLVLLAAVGPVGPRRSGGGHGRSGVGVRSALPNLSERRVVWDDYRAHRPGIRLQTAWGDGWNRRRVYDTDHDVPLPREIRTSRSPTRLAWTVRGILYSEGNLRVARAGSTRGSLDGVAGSPRPTLLALRLPTVTEPSGQTVVTWRGDVNPDAATSVDFLRRAFAFTWE